MSVASKNLFELLGNDDEGSETPTAPVKTVTKNSTGTAKANTDGTKPAAAQSTRAGFPTNQRSFRDGGVGRAANQSKSTEPRTEDRPRGGRGARGRGGAGATRHRAADDRHAKNIAPGSEKQAAQAWGATDGDAELRDEQAGEAIAQTEKQEAENEDADAESKEPEVKQITLDAYLAQRDSSLNSNLTLRQVEKPSDLRVVEKDETTDFIAASTGKTVKTKAKKVKETIKWDDSQPVESSSRGGRGGFRGGDRGDRGGDRGDRRGGARGGAPRGAPRGGDRGAPRGGALRGAPRGGRGGAPTPKVNDQSEFPALG